ncbi:hypothetical protein PTT_19223 [Pyrenophora teres f. teres 0-1]|uniref:Uncharacterized protein n=1 Tax=Pyrenophora teres f. teres (strain 0-1) TaxID=861557 RepID=E3S8F9_PYRTT|nr:hypothetical protein PTT_19223 [Pyrenophora teres f. teres 0-1]
MPAASERKRFRKTLIQRPLPMSYPMNRMLRLRTLARSQARRRNTPGIVSWDRDRLLVNKQSFSLADLRSIVKGLYKTAR